MLREATRNDAAEMARIQNESIRERAVEAYTEEQIDALAPPESGEEVVEHAFREGVHAVVAERDDEVVGFGVVDLDERVLAACFVDPEYADNGVGTAITEELEQVAAEEGAEKLWTPASLNAVGFYEKMGYETVEEIDAGEGDDTVDVEIPSKRMEKRLG